MRLFEPGRIGRLTIKNRIVMASMANRLVEADGRLSQRGIDYYVARAKGGAGLIVTGTARAARIEQRPGHLHHQPMLDDKAYVGPLSELADAVHDYDAKIAVQISAGDGRNVGTEILRSIGAVAPSPLPCCADPTIIARELTTREVEQIVTAFGYAAEVVRSAGIDAIELNCHGGFLLDEFHTSLWNRRTDKYGGDLDGRLRFTTEIIQTIKKRVGGDFPIIVKYGLTHYLESGRQIPEGLEIARKLEAAGVAALSIDAGCYGTRYLNKPTTYSPAGSFLQLAEMVRKVVGIPVISGGKLGNPDLAEEALRDGKVDFVALGRPLLADPDWANKVKERRSAEICPCIGEYEGCNVRTGEGKAIGCTVNPVCGNERELAIRLAVRPKSVLVVGGGPGGMEAARIAALRGHRVILCERNDVLGGNLIPASVPDFKSDYGDLLKYLSNQIAGLGVEVRLGTEVTPEFVRAMNPEVVIIATGGTPAIPGYAEGGEKVVTATDVLLGRKEAGEAAVVVGGGMVGCETALYLARKGKRVTIVEMLDKVMPDAYVVNRAHLLKLLADARVNILTSTRVLKVTEEGVTLVKGDGKKSALRADTVVLATGLRANDALCEALKDIALEIHTIGDCVEPRKVINAIWEGFRIARLL